MTDVRLDVAREGLRHVLRHPLRSLLTALTCAVAIAVTVNVISLSYGLDEDVRRDVSRFGRRTVDLSRFPVLVPGMRRDPLGPVEEAQIRRLLADLDPIVAPRRQTAGTAEGEASVEQIAVVAVGPSYLASLDVPIRAGRWIASGDPADGVCVLDRAAASALFPSLTPDAVLGQRLSVATPGGESSPMVVGVLEDPLTHRAVFESFDEGRGARTLTSALLSFRNVYVPAAALSGDEYAGISVVLQSEADVDEASRRMRRVWQPMGDDQLTSIQSVGVFVRKEWMDALGATTQTGALLGNIVWIIIVGVAVVMISTLNLLTIRERYDELAIRRCEGARRRDVALQVTVEGTLLALVGGIAGLPLGYLAAAVLRDIVDFPFRFEARYAVAATGVAVLLGLFASVVPARRAARLQPARVLTRRLT